MHKIKTNFDKIIDKIKPFAQNIVNHQYGNVPRLSVKPKFLDLEVMALAITAEVLAIDSENLLFHKLQIEYKNDFPTIISRRQFNDRRKNLQEIMNQIRHNQKDFKHVFKPFAKAHKRIETTFSQLCDQFMMTRNYAKNFAGFSVRILTKIAAFTLLQLINYTQNRPISQTKYALI